MIGVDVTDITVGETGHPDGVNDALFVALTSMNMGNAPAIEVYIDGEITLEHTDLRGQKTIPADDWFYIPFIKQDDELIASTALRFGDMLIPELCQDCKTHESFKYNLDKKCSKLTVYIYYKNSQEQHYKAVYETYIVGGEKDNEGDIEFIPVFRPRRSFNTYLVDDQTMIKEMSDRDSMRELNWLVPIRNV